MFKRLTFYTLCETRVRQPSDGSAGCAFDLRSAAQNISGGTSGILVGSTTTSVDNAGWTEVVIPGGHSVLHDLSVGCTAAIANASIDHVLDVSPEGADRLNLPDVGFSDIGASERLGFADVSRTLVVQTIMR